MCETLYVANTWIKEVGIFYLDHFFYSIFYEKYPADYN